MRCFMTTKKDTNFYSEKKTRLLYHTIVAPKKKNNLKTETFKIESCTLSPLAKCQQKFFIQRVIN